MTNQDHHELCDTRANGTAVVIETDDGDETTEIANEGYPCPNDAVGKYKLETHSGGTMDFWLCEPHLEHYRDQGVIVEEVDSDE